MDVRLRACGWPDLVHCVGGGLADVRELQPCLIDEVTKLGRSADHNRPPLLHQGQAKIDVGLNIPSGALTGDEYGFSRPELRHV